MKASDNQNQQDAIDFDASTVVSASAGTGKTWTLAGVYLKLLRQGLQPEEIVAITFTEKAAAEMRSRVRQEILMQIEASSDDPDAGELWRKRLARINAAPISTIHSFCSRLLRENPLEAELDPQFVVTDEVTAATLCHEAIFETIHQLITQREGRVLQLFRDFQLERGDGHGPARLIEIVESALSWLNGLGIDLASQETTCRNWLEAKWDAQQKKLAQFKTELGSTVTAVRAAFREIAEAKQPKGQAAERWVDRIRSNLTQIEEALSQLSIESSGDSVMATASLLKLSRAGRLSADPANQVLLENLPLLRKALDPVTEGSLLSTLGALKSGPLTENLVWLVGLCQRGYQARKVESRSLDFDDLLLKAYELLNSNRALRRAYKTRLKAILVDEFQDTNQIQGKLIALLSESLGQEMEFQSFDSYRTVLEKISLSRHRLFIVGDPKQSIYRFRQANVGVFVRLKEKILAAKGKSVPLIENYRSEPQLLEFSNWLFAQVMDGRGSQLLPEEVDVSHRIRFSDEDALVPAKNDCKPGIEQKPGRILLLLSEPFAKAAQGRFEEASGIAGLIGDWLEQGQLSSYREAAILFRNSKHFDVYRAALEERQIPSYVIRGRGFFGRQEISDLVSLLAFIQDPHDDLVLAEVLTSPLGGLNFNDLLELSAFRHRSSIQTLYQAVLQISSRDSNWEERLHHFLIFSHPLVFLRDRLEVPEILDRVLKKSGYEAVLMGQENGGQKCANVRKLIEMSRRFSRRGIALLDDFVSYLKDQRGLGNDRVAEAQIIGEEDDVVRIMTVHQAKGLEFDTVFLADLGSKSADEKGGRAVFDEQLGIITSAAHGIKRERLPNRLMHVCERRQADEEYEEEKRLFYVAITRSKRNLILGEGHCYRAQGHWQRWLQGAIAAVPEAEDLLQGVRHGQRAEAVISCGQASLSAIRATALSSREAKSARREIHESFPEGPELRSLANQVFLWRPLPPQVVELSPGALSHLAKCERYFYLNQMEGLAEFPPSPNGSLGAMDLGNFVHAVLESFPVGTPPGSVSEVLDRLFGEKLEPGLLDRADQQEAKEDLARFFQGRVWQRIAGNTSLQRELPFVMALRGGSVELFIRGRIDAVVWEEGRPLLLDYKYSLNDENQASKYGIPMDIYALALMKSMGSREAEVILAFLRERKNAIVSRTVTDREEIEARLLRLAQSYQEKVFKNEIHNWKKIDRSRCNALECGFRSYCWK